MFALKKGGKNKSHFNTSRCNVLQNHVCSILILTFTNIRVFTVLELMFCDL